MARKSVLLPEELYNNIQKMEVSSFGIPLNMSMAKKIDFLYFYYNVEVVQVETEEEFRKNNHNYRPELMVGKQTDNISIDISSLWD